MIEPGQYYVEKESPKRETAYPLNSKDKKFGGTPGVLTPGPGQYNPNKQDNTYRSHYSDYSTSRYPRLADTVTGSTIYSKPLNHDNPGPDNYNGHSKWIDPKPKEVQPEYIVTYQYKHGPSIPHNRVNLMKNKNWKTGEKDDTVTVYTYTYDHKITHKNGEVTDFSKAKNDRALWHQTNSKFNYYVEKDNPGPGLYEEFGSQSPQAAKSVFESRTVKLGPTKVLNQTCQYFKDPEIRIAKKSDTQTRETREMRWTHNFEVPYSVPDNVQTPGPQSYRVKKDKMLRINSQPFNSSARRALSQSQNQYPGPGEYQEKSYVAKQTKIEDMRIVNNYITNCFGGKTEKFKNGFLTPKEGPDPGAYDWTKKSKISSLDYKKSKQPRDIETINCKVIKCGDQTKPSFNSYTPNKKHYRGHVESSNYSSTRNSGARFFSNKSNWLGDKEIITRPGPGTYTNQANHERSADNKFNSTQSRFGNYYYKKSVQTTDTVGPGSYIDQGYKIKKSFNCTMNEQFFRATDSTMVSARDNK